MTPFRKPQLSNVRFAPEANEFAANIRFAEPSFVECSTCCLPSLRMDLQLWVT
jgi:hypothetical protein